MARDDVSKRKYIKDMGPYYFDYYKLATIVKKYEVPIKPMLHVKD